MISGVIFWVCFFIAALWIAWAFHLDASSKAFVDDNVPRIFSAWSEQQLLELASPELKEAMSNERADQSWSNFSRLGILKEYKGAKGQSYQNISFLTGRRHKSGYEVTAEYLAVADFQYGSANITLHLTREDGDWKIYSIFIDPHPAANN